MAVTFDRTTTIRPSVREAERSLLISIGLVILVVFVFLRSPRATLIPSVAVPVSLLGTFGVMYLFGYSIDNISLMALTICTGFVVDDAIVVIENITRHVEQGMRPLEAALHGAQEIGFTVLSMTLSLVAVFIPILMMARHRGPPVPRVCRHAFGGDSGFSARFPHDDADDVFAPLEAGTRAECTGEFIASTRRPLIPSVRVYDRGLKWVLGHEAFTLGILLITIAVNVYLLVIVPKGFFPLGDTGNLSGGIRASQDISFQAMQRASLPGSSSIIKSDPAVATAVVFTGGNGPVNTAQVQRDVEAFRRAEADRQPGDRPPAPQAQ